MRGRYAFLLAVELLRAGATQTKAAAFLGDWASRCEQPPKAKHVFTVREVESAVAAARKKQERGGLRGFGCNKELSQYCPYGLKGRDRCPYIARNKRQPKRESITSLLGAVNLAKTLPVPEHWKPSVTLRRRYLLIVIGALEAAKGFAGGELLTSYSELAYESRLPRTNVRRDLEEMAEAGWISFKPGLSRKGRSGLPPQGARIRRLLPGESQQAELMRLNRVMENLQTIGENSN